MILAKTIKGYTLGKHFEGRNATHQMKKLALQDLKDFRDAPAHPDLATPQLEENPYLPPYYHPGPDAPEIRYMLDRRRTLGGFLPERRTKAKVLTLPGRDVYKALKKGSGNQAVATTMATVRTFKELLRDKEIGKRIVPIIPDEARTFGMDSWFPTLKIYNRNGQLYTAVDAELMLAYKESEIGQILHEGINEAGSTASFTAVGTSYSTHNEPMIPIYIFYSMFGFQRTGDGFWAAADQMARGFVLGATAGRTTLTGEGLQHADGHSLLLASTNPAVVAYDPAFAYEIAYIVESGLARMYGEDPENIYFYITIYNEPYVQPAEPDELRPRGPAARHLPLPRRQGEAHQRRADPGLGRRDARGAACGGPAGRRLGRRRRRLVGDQLGRAQPRRRGGREGAAAPSRTGPRAVPYVTKALAETARAPSSRSSDWMRGGTRADPAVGARHLRHAGHRRVRLLRHPARGAAVLQHRRRVGGGGGAGGAGPRRRDRSVGRHRGRQAVPDRRRAGGAGADVRPRRRRLAHDPALVGGIRQKPGVAFRGDRQPGRPARSRARAAGRPSRSRCCAASSSTPGGWRPRPST